ncbi:hypothetical protein HID58_013420, partial [Brassica napus]
RRLGLGFWRQLWRSGSVKDFEQEDEERETIVHSSRSPGIETYQSVGQALGIYDKADVEGGRVRVFVNGDNPLKFECKVGFDNGDVVKATIIYEDLYRHCFTCKRISHEEGTCPELTENQREHNRIKRIEQKEMEERATKEAFSLPQRQNLIDSEEKRYTPNDRERDHRKETHFSSSSYRVWNNEKENSQDLRDELQERRDYHSKNVWKRLDKNSKPEYPRNRERFHPYHHNSYGYPKEKTRDTASSLEWRVREPNDRRQDPMKRDTSRNRVQLSRGRNRVSPDLQRTISDNFRRSPQKSIYRGRYSHSPPSRNMEWRPVNKNPERGEGRGERNLSMERTRTLERTRTSDSARHLPQKEKDLLSTPSGKTITSETADNRIDRNTRPDKKGVTERTPARETEEERRRCIRGKAIAEDINEGQINLELEQTVMGASHLPDPILNEIPENQVYVEKVQNRSPPSVGKNLLNKATETVAPPSNRALNIQDPVKERNKTVDNGKQGIEEDQQLMSEEEITQIMEEYASVDLEMDDDMVDDDDLLDDMDDEDAAVPETQEVLIQNKKDLSKKGVMDEDTTAKEMRSTSSPAAGLERVTKSQKEKSKKDKPQASYLHKH